MYTSSRRLYLKTSSPIDHMQSYPTSGYVSEGRKPLLASTSVAAAARLNLVLRQMLILTPL